MYRAFTGTGSGKMELRKCERDANDRARRAHERLRPEIERVQDHREERRADAAQEVVGDERPAAEATLHRWPEDKERQ